MFLQFEWRIAYQNIIIIIQIIIICRYLLFYAYVILDSEGGLCAGSINIFSARS